MKCNSTDCKHDGRECLMSEGVSVITDELVTDLENLVGQHGGDSSTAIETMAVVFASVVEVFARRVEQHNPEVSRAKQLVWSAFMKRMLTLCPPLLDLFPEEIQQLNQVLTMATMPREEGN